MIKRAINTVTMLLVVLGVGVLCTKASPQVNRELVSQGVDTAVYEVRDFASPTRRFDFVKEMNQHVTGDGQDMRVREEGSTEAVGREMPDRLVGDAMENLRGVVMMDDMPVFLSVRVQGVHFYFTQCNLRKMSEHPNTQSHLAFRNLRGSVPHQFESVQSGLRPASSQMVPVFETVNVLKELQDVDVLAMPMRTSFAVLSTTPLRHGDVVMADLLALVYTTGNDSEFTLVFP